MTTEQIFKLAKTCGFDEFTGKKETEESDDTYWECWANQLLNFAQRIRQETIKDVITTLKGVPNSEANRTAINRITNMENG
jgi:hypothetical protein